MTLAVRNALFVLGITIGTLLVILFGAAVYLLWLDPGEIASIPLPDSEEWLGYTWRVTRTAALFGLVSSGALALVALFGAITSARLFRRVSSQEIYFVTLFLLTLTLEVLRLGELLIEFYSLPAFYGVVATRVVLISRILGGLAIFAAGIYNAGAEYPRVGTVSALLLVLALLIVYLVPVDPHQMQASLMHHTGADGGIDAILLFLGLGAAVNYAIGWAKGYHERGGIIFLSVTMLVMAQILLQNLPGTFTSSVGGLLLLSGTAIFIAVNRSYHLWY
jgi:hypothetical protein